MLDVVGEDVEARLLEALVQSHAALDREARAGRLDDLAQARATG